MSPNTGFVAAVVVVVTGAGVVGGLVDLAVVVEVSGLAVELLVLGAADGLGLAVTGIKVKAGMLLMAFKVLWLTVVGARVDFCLKPLRHVPETLFVKPSTLILKIAI